MGYQGDVGIILINTSQGDIVKISNGDRIAQIVFAKFERIEWDEKTRFVSSERGSAGFGSSGKL